MREVRENMGPGMVVMHSEDGTNSKVSLHLGFPRLLQEAMALVALADSLCNVLVTGS